MCSPCIIYIFFFSGSSFFTVESCKRCLSGLIPLTIKLTLALQITPDGDQEVGGTLPYLENCVCGAMVAVPPKNDKGELLSTHNTQMLTDKCVLWASAKNFTGTLSIAFTVISDFFPYGDQLFGPHKENGPHYVTV